MVVPERKLLEEAYVDRLDVDAQTLAKRRQPVDIIVSCQQRDCTPLAPLPRRATDDMQVGLDACW
mgnify:CR=1 FL=1